MPTAPTKPVELFNGTSTEPNGGVESCPVWLTVKLKPPAAIKPALGGPLFAATVKPIVPVPLPAAPFVIVSHVAVSDALQEHPAGASIAKLPVPPPEPTLMNVDGRLYAQATEA
jgi:hypothetical protein